MLKDDPKIKLNKIGVLICGMTSNAREGCYYIRVDRHLIKISNNFLKSFEILIKFYYIFDLAYPSELQIFYEFVTNYILKIENINNKFNKILKNELDKIKLKDLKN